MADAVLEIVALGRTPIREGSPAGDAVTYDPDFESIKIEIAKLDAAAGIPPEYSKIVSLSTAILGSKSKDLTVACYLAHALFFTRGYAGLRDGFDLCRETLANFWETLYPEMKRMRGRTGAIAWLNERAAAAIARKPPLAADLEALTAAAESLAQLSAVVLEKFTDDAPVLSDARRALEDAKRVASELAAPRAAPQPSAGAAASSAGSAPASVPSAIDSPDAALRVLISAGNDVKRAAVFLIQKDPSSPVPYLVTRGIVWGMVRELPPHTDNVTPFPAPDPNLANAWTAMADAGNWQALVVEAEQRLFGSPFWLDLNRYVARALEALGHSAAHRAVVDVTLALTRRLPGLVELSFQGGETPFASEETRAWLAAEARAAGTAAGEAALAIGATPAAASDADEEAFHAAVRDAKGLASRKKIVDAVKLIQERVHSAPSPRVRFRYRAALADICLEAGQHAVASAQYEALLDEIERHALDEWEPDLSREVLEASYICEKRMSQNGQRNGTDSQARLGRLYARICRIDLLSALALERKK